MSKKKCEVEEMTDILRDYLSNYEEEIYNDVVETTNETTKRAIEDLKESSRRLFKRKRKKNPYWKGWEEKLQLKGKLKYHRVIWNRTNYQLTHLLEFGHHKRTGDGWVDGTPHIKPIEDKYTQEFVDLLEKRIKKGN